MWTPTRVLILLLAVGAGVVVCVAVYGFLTDERGLFAGPAAPPDEPPAPGAPEERPPAPRVPVVPPPEPVPDLPLPTLEDAQAHLAVDQPEEALELLKRILAKDPDDVRALAMCGRIHLGFGTNFDRLAEKDFRAALQAGAENTDVLEGLAESLMLRAPNDAVKHLERAVELDPNRARTRALLARAHLRRRDYAAARESAERALSMDGGDQLAQWVFEQVKNR